MKARVNRVIEPITVVVTNGKTYYTVQLEVGDLIKREDLEMVVTKNDERFHIPDNTMDVIKTEPAPNLEVEVWYRNNDCLHLRVYDSEFFTADEIAPAVKKAIEDYKANK